MNRIQKINEERKILTKHYQPDLPTVPSQPSATSKQEKQVKHGEWIVDFRKFLEERELKFKKFLQEQDAKRKV